MIGCDHASEIAYFLGKNQDISAHIASLNPVAAAFEIAKLETKFAGPNPPAQKSTTKAPEPTSPVGGGETPPKKVENMSMEEYAAWRESGGT